MWPGGRETVGHNVDTDTELLVSVVERVGVYNRTRMGEAYAKFNL